MPLTRHYHFRSFRPRRGQIWFVRETVGRENAILRLREQNPCATLQQIGDLMGITREWVRQLLKRAGAPTRRTYQTYRCHQCGRDFPPLNRKKPSPFCSMECQKAFHTIELVCDECGTHFPRKVIYIVRNAARTGQRHIFCGRRCQGQWLARTVGFGVHPENARMGQWSGRKKKWDYELVWQRHLETGYGARRLSRLLGIPEGTISFILVKYRKGPPCH